MPPLCPACGGGAPRPAGALPANADGPLSEPYELWTCPGCGAGLTWPVPPPEAFAALYAFTPRERAGGRGFAPAEALVSALEGRRLRRIQALRPPPGRLLEIGAGKGRFAERAARAGWEVVALDPAPAQVEAARARYGLQVRQGELAQAGFDDGSFDVVAAWHVLEHLEDPRGVLRHVRRVLRPGGLFACEVPNFASWQARLTGRHWLHLDPPRHLVHFTPLALRRLLEAAGFVVLEAATFSFEMGAYGLLQSLLNRAGLEPNWLYGWLRGRGRGAPARLLLHALAAAALAGPAVAAELAAVAMGGGAVIRVVTRRG